MGAGEKSTVSEYRGVKSEGGTAALYHIISENAMGAGEKSTVSPDTDVCRDNKRIGRTRKLYP